MATPTGNSSRGNSPQPPRRGLPVPTPLGGNGGAPSDNDERRVAYERQLEERRRREQELARRREQGDAADERERRRQEMMRHRAEEEARQRAEAERQRNADPLPDFDNDDLGILDDGIFENIPEDDVVGEYDSTDEDADYGFRTGEEETVPAAPERPVEAPAKRRKTEGKPPALNAAEDFAEPSDFTDKQKRKVKPFGGAKSLKKDEIGKLDTRKDRAKRAKIIQSIVVIGVILMVVLSAYRTVFPPDTVTAEEVEAIAAAAAGDIGYPLDRATGFAKSFVEAYLTSSRNNPEAVSALEYFYGGNQNLNLADEKRTIDASVKQEVINSPSVFGVTTIDANAGSFVVGAFVKTTYSEQGASEPTEQSSTDWIFFQVNVFYDAETDALAIAPDSPTLTERPTTFSSADVPAAQSLGEQVDAEIEADLRPTIIGFLQGYAVTSPDNSSALQQYVVRDAEPELLKGLEGRYVFQNQDNPESSVTVTTFLNATGEYKADVTVTWKSVIPGTDATGVSYTSRYVMTIVEAADGGYLVSRFVPMSYVMADTE